MASGTFNFSSGHTIWDRVKTALTSRSKLWFKDANVTDASADGATKVEVVTELASENAFDALATDGSADGIYTFPDSGTGYLTADMVGYGAGTVKDALDNTVVHSYVGIVAKSTSKTVTIPYSSRGILYFFGGSDNLFGQIQYDGTTTQVFIRTISLGSHISVSLSGQTLTVSNLNTGAALHIDCMILSGNSPTMA